MPSNLELLVDVEPTHRGRIQSHLPYPSQPEMVLLALYFETDYRARRYVTRKRPKATPKETHEVQKTLG